MPNRPSTQWPVRLLALASGIAMSAAALAQAATPTGVAKGAQDAGAASQPTINQLLTDFIHYVKIDQKELARSFGQALLDRKISGVEFAGLVEDSPQGETRFEEAIRDAMRDPALEDVAAGLLSLRETGRRDRARDPQEIGRNVTLLGETQRARLLARSRLAFAGEFAAPQLLEAIGKGDKQIVQAEAQELLAAMGPDAVAPLSAALIGLDPAMQERVARVLGRAGQPTAIPYLVECHNATESAQVKGACAKAISEINPSINPTADSSVLFVALAEEYYAEPPAITRQAGEEHQLVWNFEPGVGLYATPVRTEVYHEAMAMRLCERALRKNAAVTGAAPLWLAANFSRHLDQPADYENPLYPPERRDAMYYAVAAGAPAVSDVLARALRDSDTPLARLAIDALARTAGAETLAASEGGENALQLALAYPDRRTRFEAAMALADAQPRATFPGSDRVVPILAGAIRDAASRYAVVVTPDVARQQALQRSLQAQGYTVLAPSATLEGAADVIAEAPGVDLIVSDLTSGATLSMLEHARSSAKLGAAPVLALLPQSGYTELFPRFQSDPLTRVARAGISDAELAAAATRLVERASGAPVTPEQASELSLRALRALRDISLTGSDVYQIGDAAKPLMSALDVAKGKVRLDIADVLSRIDSPECQTKLMEAAFASSGAERLALFERVSDSARRFGNRLPERLVTRLIETASTAQGEEATGAAALVGALNLPNSALSPLILGK